MITPEFFSFFHLAEVLTSRFATFEVCTCFCMTIFLRYVCDVSYIYISHCICVVAWSSTLLEQQR